MIRFILLLLPLLLFGDVDAKIEAIQHASIAERFKLMNAFKKEIIQMREEKRLQALRKLQAMAEDNNTKQSLEQLQENKKIKYEIENRNNLEREERDSHEEKDDD